MDDPKLKKLEAEFARMHAEERHAMQTMDDYENSIDYKSFSADERAVADAKMAEDLDYWDRCNKEEKLAELELRIYKLEKYLRSYE